MKITCIADCHGDLTFQCPEGDLLLIAGDIFGPSDVFLQHSFFMNEFYKWIKKQPFEKNNIIFVPGNHDWLFYKENKQLLPSILPFVYLEDQSLEILGLKIYGTPWQPIFLNWAFNLPEEELERKWQFIPDDVDILLLHAPPYGILDRARRYNERGYENIGSPSLRKRIFEIKKKTGKLKLVVFGHNHNQYGEEEHMGIKFINCSLVNEDYKMTNKPVVAEINL